MSSLQWPCPKLEISNINKDESVKILSSFGRNYPYVSIFCGIDVSIMVPRWIAFGRSRCGLSSRSKCGLILRSVTLASTSTPQSGLLSNPTWLSSGSRGVEGLLKLRRSNGRLRWSLPSMAFAFGNPQLTPVCKDYNNWRWGWNDHEILISFHRHLMVITCPNCRMIL